MSCQVQKPTFSIFGGYLTHLQIIIDLNNKPPDFITNDAVKLTSIIKYNFFRTYAKFLNSLFLFKGDVMDFCSLYLTTTV